MANKVALIIIWKLKSKIMKTILSFLILFLLADYSLLAQEWWNPPNDLKPTMNAGNWCNEEDDGHTSYFVDTEADNQVVVYAADGSVYSTSDEQEMRKAMEAAEDGVTYIPTGEAAAKWTTHTKGESDSKEGKWSRILRFLGLKKSGNGIIDGCDPTDIDIWMNGGNRQWGKGMIKLAGRAPIAMRDPRREAGIVARSIR